MEDGTIERLRERLSQMSGEMLSLLNERARVALTLAREKQARGWPLRDPQREKALLRELNALNDGPLDSAQVHAVFRAVIDACAALMETRPSTASRLDLEKGPPVAVEIRGHRLGAGTPPVYIAGPCAIESEAQLGEVAGRLARLGVHFLRAGAFKPRTSPDAFQGLGEPALRWLRDVARRYGLVTVTEATSSDNLPLVAEYADIIQIGARNMFNYELLRAAGRSGKPVLLKRSFAATLGEWLSAAQYIAAEGNERIVLCERGIRTFTPDTRATLDLAVVPLVLARSRLPIVVDVSHAAGRRDILPSLARAAFAAGAHGVMVEVHPDPDTALSDALQQISLEAFATMVRDVAQGLLAAGAALTPLDGRASCG